ncbi:MAG: UDP-N-acetylglucosamine 2-epimerase (non-hydrolyzing) [Clostridiaceae bacterium]|jgi:UDP-N-acetylglucosamine 2-epimerase|nr:UDP-N-acetylglucosamine 2-epimerase (non-hydrolyzing) [Clostridiaceae bacterium]
MKQNKIKVLSVFGTRPEAIKMAPLVLQLNKTSYIDNYVCVTAQHREMLDGVLEMFQIVPDFDLNIMQKHQTISDITVRALEGLDKIYKQLQPDIVLVHGDTTTSFVGALAAFYNKIKLGHVEAGLRTFDKYSPYPEEVNRRLTGQLADLHFAPTTANKNNLLNENINSDNIFITGNTVIDALQTTVSDNYKLSAQISAADYTNNKVIIMTAHRRENLGEPLRNICNAIHRLVEEFDNIEVVYPVHPNPAVRQTVSQVLGNIQRVHLIEPVDVRDLHNAINKCYFVMTDSGGLQEEAPSLGKPVLVLRKETERPEAVTAGTVKLAGVEEDNIYLMARNLLTMKTEYDKMARAVNPYGDGKASSRIVDGILYHFGLGEKPKDFI